MTQSEIAERIGVSQMHVSRLIRRALARLRAVASDRDASWPTARRRASGLARSARAPRSSPAVAARAWSRGARRVAADPPRRYRGRALLGAAAARLRRPARRGW